MGREVPAAGVLTASHGAQNGGGSISLEIPQAPQLGIQGKCQVPGLGYHIYPSPITAKSWDSGQAPQTTGPSEGQCLLLKASLGFLPQDSHFIIPSDISARHPGLISFLSALLAARV